MRSFRYIYIVIALLVAGCSDTLDEGISQYGDGEGCVALTLSLPSTRSLSEEEVAKALETSVLKIYDSSNSLVRRYEPATEMPEQIYILAGEYSVTLSVGDGTQATLDADERSYYGEREMSIVAQSEQSLEITCAVLNHTLSVSFDESLTENLVEGYTLRVVAADSYSSEGYSADGAIKLEYTESGDGYFIIPDEYASRSLAWEFSGAKSLDGGATPVTLQGVLSGVEAQTRSALSFKYSSYLSFEYLTISIDDSTTDFDDSMSFKPQPIIEPVGFEIDEIQVGDHDFSFTTSALKSISRVEIIAGERVVTPFDGGEVVACDDATYSVVADDEGEFTIHKSIFRGFGRGGEQSIYINVYDETGSMGEFTLPIMVSGVSTISTYDYWYNTGSVDILIVDSEVESVGLSYRSAGQQDWVECAVSDNGDGTHSAAMAPTWSSSQNSYGYTIYTLMSGVSPESDTEFLLTTDGEEHAVASLSTGDASQSIPNADLTDSGLTCYSNDSNSSTDWVSGNNSWADGLCSLGSYGGEVCAVLSAKEAYSNFAAGNLVFGQFEFNGIIAQTGTMSFGQPFEWQERPRTFNLRYAATIGTVSSYTSSYLSSGDTDPARIYFAIVNWSSRHEVTAGSGTPSGTWNPEDLSTLDSDETIIGYAATNITESTSGYKLSDLELEIYYYDKDAAIPTRDIAIVIACTTSAYGDYMTGSLSNRMYVKDFDFGY